MLHVQSIVDRVSRAIEFVFLFTLAAGCGAAGGLGRDAVRATLRLRRAAHTGCVATAAPSAQIAEFF